MVIASNVAINIAANHTAAFNIVVILLTFLLRAIILVQVVPRTHLVFIDFKGIVIAIFFLLYIPIVEEYLGFFLLIGSAETRHHQNT